MELTDLEKFEAEKVNGNLICPWCGNDDLTVTDEYDFTLLDYRVTCPRCQHFVYLSKRNPMREWASYCLDVINSRKYPPTMAVVLKEELEKYDGDPLTLLYIMDKYKYILEAGLVSKSKDEDKDEVDMVNHPSHYETGKYECIEVMVEALGADVVMHFCLGNAFKYLYRCRRKNGVEDIEKARWYLNKYLELQEDFGNEDN